MTRCGKPENILVTGAGGFVGERVCEAVAARGGRIYPVVRRAESEKQIAIGDIGPLTDWSSALDGVDVVVHLAARVHLMSDGAVDPLAEFRRVNVAGTRALAEQAARAGVGRLVFVSSIKVNGENTSPDAPFTSDDLPRPADPYGVSKHEAEQVLRWVSAETGMEVVVIRPCLVYGPGVRANFLSMLRWLDKGVPLPLGAIHNQRSLLALDNLVDLIVTCTEHPAAANQTLLAADGKDLSTTALLRRLGDALGTPARLVPVPTAILRAGAALIGKRAIVERLCGSLQVDISKTRSVLGWKPPLSVDEGLARTVEWYRASHRGGRA